MKFLLTIFCGLFLAGCCKQTFVSAEIEMTFTGFNSSMKTVKVISVNGFYYDTTILTLDDNKRAIYILNSLGLHSDSLFVTATDPNNFYAFKDFKTKSIFKGGGCGGPADEIHTSFTLRDSVYNFSLFHRVEIKQ